MIDFEQAANLLGLAAARDQRTVGDADILAWHDDLNAANIPYTDARAAITHFYAVHNASLQPDKRWRITSVDIIDIARRLRHDRLEGFQYEPGDADETPAQYLARLRTQITATADGVRPPAPAIESGRPRPELAAALDALTRAVPNPDDETAEPAAAQPRPDASPFSVPCPVCAARLGHHCRWPNGNRRTTHPARRRAAAGEPLTTPGTEDEAAQRRAAAAAHLASLTDDERAQLDAFQQQMRAS